MEEMLNSGIDGILRAYQLRVAGLTMEQHQVCNLSCFLDLSSLIFGKEVRVLPAWLHIESFVLLRHRSGLYLTDD